MRLVAMTTVIMVHLLRPGNVSSNQFWTNFIVTFILAAILLSFLLVVPAVRRLKWKVIYLTKVVYCSLNLVVMVISLWWSDWLQGHVTCIDHITGHSRYLTPAKLSVHISLDNLHMMYHDMTTEREYKFTAQHSGMFYPSATDVAHRASDIDIEESSPLPLAWVVEQFDSTTKGPQLGYTLRPVLYAMKIAIWLSASSAVLGWLAFSVGDMLTSSLLCMLSGVIQIGAPLVFALSTMRIHRQLFMGHQIMTLRISWVVSTFLPVIGIINIIGGMVVLLLSSKLCRRYLDIFIRPTEILFVEFSNPESSDADSDEIKITIASNSTVIELESQQQNDTDDDNKMYQEDDEEMENHPGCHRHRNLSYINRTFTSDD